MLGRSDALKKNNLGACFHWKLYKHSPLPGARGENAWTPVSCSEYGCHLGAEQRKCRESSSQNLNCEPTWWSDMLLHKVINVGSTVQGKKKKRKRSGRKENLLKGRLQTDSSQYNPKLFNSQQTVYPVGQVNMYRGAGVLHLLLLIKKLQSNSLFLKDSFSMWGCRLQKMKWNKWSQPEPQW